MKKNKIVVIGAGSASFGLTNLGAIMRTRELHGSELCLVDINMEGLEQILRLAERINREWQAGFDIRGGVDRCEFLQDADFVILSVAKDREKCWQMDHDIAKKYSIMHYAENGGPGGFMHTARNLALIMPILKDIERLCPDAWVLNFTNPVPRICIAAARYTRLKMVGICHQLSFGYLIAGNILADALKLDVPEGYLFRWDVDWKEYNRIIREAEERIDILAAGINHFTWMLSVRDRLTGNDLYPLFRKRYMEGFHTFEPLTRELFGILGLCPVPGDCHMVEYLPFTHNMYRDTWRKYDIQMFPFHEGEMNRNKCWAEIANMAAGNQPVHHLKTVKSERVEHIIAAIANNSHVTEAAVNIPNCGYIKNLPEGAIVEVPAVVDAYGIHGHEAGCLPEPVAELCRRQITIAEMAVEASVKGDRKLALQALILDPMIDDPDVAEKLLYEYLEAEKEYLPQFHNAERYGFQ